MQKKGFSLVELSIVLVILGLLTGGILTGQSLIRAAELRSVTTEFQKYQTATMTFRDKYFALPGDMRNATDFWGSLGGEGFGDGCMTLESTGTATCNGTGDGRLGFVAAGSGTVWQWSERFLFWKHLENAGLIEGQYTGRTDSTTNSFAQTSSKNVPKSKFPAAFWSIDGGSSVAGTTYHFPYPESIIYAFASSTGSPLLSAEEVWGIDKKIDDERPGTGRVRTAKFSSGNPGCASSDDPSTAIYNVSYKTNNCGLAFFVY